MQHYQFRVFENEKIKKILMNNFMYLIINS